MKPARLSQHSQKQISSDIDQPEKQNKPQGKRKINKSVDLNSIETLKKSILLLPPIKLGQLYENNRQNSILVKKMIAINQRESAFDAKPDRIRSVRTTKDLKQQEQQDTEPVIKGVSQHLQKITKQEKKLRKRHEEYAQALRESYEVKDYKKKFQFKKFDKSVLQMKRYNLPLFDETSKNLARQKVFIFITVQELEMFNFIPQLMNDKYFFELKISTRNPRKIIPETYENFTKSVINEFFSYEEVVSSRIMYVGVFLIRGGIEKFLADFELDITPYFLLNGEYQVQYDLRNLRELWSTPHYIQKDLRKRGTIKFNLKITSRLWNFLLPADKQLHPEFKTDEFFNKFKDQE